MVSLVSKIWSWVSPTELRRHPGYGCWLSGIDVNTQLTNQQHNDPYLAVVVGSSPQLSMLQLIV